MKTPTQQDILALRQQGKTFQEIANMYGCSRQNIHQIANSQPQRKTKTPSKAELYAQVEALTRENIALLEKLDAEERERWNKLKDRAFELCRELIPFPNGIIQFLTLEHIDKAGYWFTFELINDSTRQTFCVRHTDL